MMVPTREEEEKYGEVGAIYASSANVVVVVVVVVVMIQAKAGSRGRREDPQRKEVERWTRHRGERRTR
jgi:hypothetical protein